jgi:hypothetical protein
MDPRTQRGYKIASTQTIIETEGSEIFLVPSQSAQGRFYRVYYPYPSAPNLTDHWDKCACPCEDFRGRKDWCKHIWAAHCYADVGVRPDPQNPEPPKPQKPTYPQNWPAYNAAQTNEKDRFQVFLSNLCRFAPAHIRHVGRPRASLPDIVFAMAFKVYTTFPTRRFMSRAYAQ